MGVRHGVLPTVRLTLWQLVAYVQYLFQKARGIINLEGINFKAIARSRTVRVIEWVVFITCCRRSYGHCEMHARQACSAWEPLLLSWLRLLSFEFSLHLPYRRHRHQTHQMYQHPKPGLWLAWPSSPGSASSSIQLLRDPSSSELPGPPAASPSLPLL